MRFMAMLSLSILILLPTLSEAAAPDGAWQVKMQCDAGEAPRVTTLTLKAGWSNTLKGPCVIGQAVNTLTAADGTTQTSDVVSRSWPDDCLAVPEAPVRSSVMVGLGLLSVLVRRRALR